MNEDVIEYEDWPGSGGIWITQLVARPLRLLKIKDGAGGDYWWVECGACEWGWQVPHYAVA